MKKKENNSSEIIIVHDSTGHEYVLKDEISRGGQGAVFRTDDHNIAVKLALENDTFLTAQNHFAQNVIDKKNSEFTKLILLPISPKTHITLPILTFQDAVGYTMQLMGDMDSFQNVFEKSGIDYTNPWFQETFEKDDPMGQALMKYVGSGGARKRLHAYYLCACTMAKLHSRGLVYCDFSDNNVFMTFEEISQIITQKKKKKKVNPSHFMDELIPEEKEFSPENATPPQEMPPKEQLPPESPQPKKPFNYLEWDDIIFSAYENDNVWLIDADNLNYQSVTVKGAYYTPNYGAPEVVRGEGCTFYSDCYAFAVSLFWNLTLCHPFKGEAYDNYDGDEEDFGDGADDALNQGKFAFVCDEEDSSNESDAPMIGMLLESTPLMETFRRMFSENGKHHIRFRPSMFEWMQVVADTLDTTMVCTHCRMPYHQNFGSQCPWCDSENDMLTVEAFTSEHGVIGTKTGFFQREVREFETLSIPLRIMTKVNPNAPKEMAFQIQYHSGNLTVSSLHPEYTFHILPSQRLIMGTYETDKNCIEIQCSNQQHEEYCLKIRMVTNEIK